MVVVSLGRFSMKRMLLGAVGGSCVPPPVLWSGCSTCEKGAINFAYRNRLNLKKEQFIKWNLTAWPLESLKPPFCWESSALRFFSATRMIGLNYNVKNKKHNA